MADISDQSPAYVPALSTLCLSPVPGADDGDDDDAGSRYVYDMYYEKEAISKQLYEWLLKNGYADANLIAKWKKQGYEKVGHRTTRPSGDKCKDKANE